MLLPNEAAAYDLDQDDACPNKKTHFYEFKEYDTLIKLIINIPINIKSLREKEKSFEQFLIIVDAYQEQPHLIDPFLSDIFDKLISMIKSYMTIQSVDNDALINECFTYMHCLTKMRGFKKIVQYLPHEINDFEPVLNLLARQDMNDVYTWQTRYLLLIWLSIVCMVPFDLSRFNSIDESDNKTILKRFLDVCIPYLSASDKSQDACAYVLAKFMSRPDLKQVILPQFLDQLFQIIKDEKKSGNNIKLLGALKCLSSIYKYGKREDILKYTLSTLKTIIEQDLLASSQLAIIRKFHIKIVQRIGITFFKLKVAKWRYERGSRVLMEKINAKQDFQIKKKQDIENDDDEQIPGEIEDIIEQLLTGLKDTDTIVRWSAAKGIGRITNRLPKEMAHDILSSVLDLFTFVEDDLAWHGGCLTIAELGRRGLLLPDQLKIVVPIVLKALVFDKKLGNYSLGRNVRDSACYVCWSLARAFEPDVLQPYVNQIAGTLLIVTVFDREVNCRRAASAAFQENVGRQGQFPHGIDILTKCDYYAVGQINNCYLNLSVFIGEFEEYRQQIIDHLIEYKFNHWDQSIRELTSKSLFNLTNLCPDYMAFKIIPQLLRHSYSIDLNTRHGALICLAELVHALCEIIQKENLKLNKYFDSETIVSLSSVISKIFDGKYFTGSGGESMRPAVCFFIKKLSISNLFNLDKNSEHFKLAETFLNDCELFLKQSVEYVKESIQIAAAETIPFYCDLKFPSKTADQSSDCLIESYLNNLKSTRKEYVRSGYCLAVGFFPDYLLVNNSNFKNIIRTLIQASKTLSGPFNSNGTLVLESTEQTTKPDLSMNKKILLPLKQVNDSGWVQARKDAIKGLTNILKLVKKKQDIKLFELDNEILLEIIACYFYGLNDYSIDSKGDSGSKVREAAIEGLESFIELCGKYELTEIINNEEIMTNVIGKIMQQCTERIDRTRNLAGKSFSNIIHNKYLNLDYLPYIQEIRFVFKQSMCSLLDWNVAHTTFPLFVKLLNIKQFQINLLTGFIFSIGSLTESLVKSATSSFLKELKEIYMNQDKKIYFKELIDNILILCQNHLTNDRLSTSIIKTVDLIIQNDFLNQDLIKSDHIPFKLITIFIDNVKVTKDMQKLIAYIDLFADMLQFEEERVREKAMIQLSIMLCHPYPRIRKTVASKLFEALLNYGEIFENEQDNDECTLLLTETNWDQSTEIIRPIRNRICDLTKTPKPVLVKQPGTNP